MHLLSPASLIPLQAEMLPNSSASYLLPAKAIMAKSKTVRETEEVDVLKELLKSTRHSGFPVVEADSRAFVGFILREKLEEVLARQAQQAAEAGHAPSGPPPGASRRELCRISGAASHRDTTPPSGGGPPPERLIKRRNSLPGRMPTAEPVSPQLRAPLGVGPPSRRDASLPSRRGSDADRSPAASMHGRLAGAPGSADDNSASGSRAGSRIGSHRRLTIHRSSSSDGHHTPLQRRRASADDTLALPEGEASRSAPDDSKNTPPRRRRASFSSPHRNSTRVTPLDRLDPLKRRSSDAKEGSKLFTCKRQHSRPMVDLRPHCDSSPFTVHELLPLYMVSRLFMSMGLRHLCVLDGRSCVCGVITRKDFSKAQTAGLQELSSYAHLNEGGVVQKRMLDASHQAERLKAQGASRRCPQEGSGLPRTLSEPSLLQLAAARAAAERAENGSFKRHRSHAATMNKRMATYLRQHMNVQAGVRGFRDAVQEAVQSKSPPSRSNSLSEAKVDGLGLDGTVVLDGRPQSAGGKKSCE
eukprot:Transcript_21789.p1 GENE.Transcript_21789~~Transcript_21789.p1  ORF type:complete len:528 (-),score=129.91 Transcript_21789:109-1692(-)